MYKVCSKVFGIYLFSVNFYYDIVLGVRAIIRVVI